MTLGLATAILAEIPGRILIARLGLAIPFVLAALPLAVTTRGTVLWRFPWGWPITQEGLTRTVSIVLRSLLSVQMSIVLTATTSPPHLLAALRALGVPRLIVATLALMWRYLFVLVDEAQRLLRAREARSGITTSEHAKHKRAGGTLLWRAQITGGMAGNLLLRGLERADRTYGAMCARGYNGEVRSLPWRDLTSAERVAVLLACTLLGFFALASVLLWG